MAKELTYNATLIERNDLTPTLGIFRVKPDEDIPGRGEANAAPWFVPGQYLFIGLNNPDPEKAGVQRPMSIASAPEEHEYVEYYIRYVNHPTSDNPLTHLLWKAKPGDRMYMRPQPKGHFTLPGTVGDSDPRLKVFVSAGTGLAPFYSIVRSHLNQNPSADLGQFAIMHGASYPDDLGYQQELGELASASGLRYVPTISRPKEAPGWTGTTGRVEDLFLPERLEALEVQLGLTPGELTPERAVVFVCGLQGTIGRSIERLACRGFIPDHKRIRAALEVPEEAAPSLYFEQYDTEPVIDLGDEELLERLKAELTR